MFGDAGQGNVEPGGQPGNRGVPKGQLRQDGAAGGVGERREGCIQSGIQILNHTV